MPYRPPPPPQRFVDLRPTLHRFRYEKIAGLVVPNENQPGWVMYRPHAPGFVVRHADRDHDLEPGKVYVISPQTSFDLRLRQPLRPAPEPGFFSDMKTITAAEDEAALIRQGYMVMLFAHLTLGHDADRAQAGLFAVSEDRCLTALLDEAAALLQQTPTQFAFGMPASCVLTSALLAVLARLPATVWDRPALDPRLDQALRWAREHLAADLSTPALARQAQLSPNTFARLLHEQTGHTPQTVVRRYRLEQARLLLTHSELTIDQIAERCGFCDRFYFTRVFREQLDRSPAAYRRQTQH